MINTVKIPAEFSVRSIGVMHSQLAQAMGGGMDVTIDASDLVSCDVAGAQLLVSVTRTARRTGLNLRLVCDGDALAVTMARAGIGMALDGDRISFGEA